VQTAGASGAVSEVVTLSALESVAINGSNVLVTIPLVQQSMATINVTTAGGGGCAAGTDCFSFNLAVPGVNAFVGAVGAKPTQAAGSASYTVDAQPVPHTDNTPVCGQPDAQSAPVTVTPGASSPVATLSFTGCS